MKQTFRITIGMLTLIFILSVFFSTPSMISPGGVSLIDTEIQRSSGNEIFVKTKLDFAVPETMKKFPERIDDWQSVSYNWSHFEQSLGADIMLSRAYRHPSSLKPVFFLVIQAKNLSSFHPPMVCYPLLGYEIEEVGGVKVPISNASWAEEPWRSEHEGFIFRGELSAKKLVLVKPEIGERTERRVVLYYYVKDERMSMPKEITMIRVSALAPLNGSYQDTLEIMEKLIADTFPEMFEIRQKERTIAEELVIEHGALGCALIAVLVLIPIGVIFLPLIKGKQIKLREVQE